MLRFGSIWVWVVRVCASWEDVADVVGGAVGGVERLAAPEEMVEFVFERGELTLAVPDVGEFGAQERFDVAARCHPVAAQLDDAVDLAQREPGGLCAADETQPVEGRVVVLAVAAGGAARLIEQSAFLVEADRFGWEVDGGGEFSDAHVTSLPLDLDL